MDHDVGDQLTLEDRDEHMTGDDHHARGADEQEGDDHERRAAGERPPPPAPTDARRLAARIAIIAPLSGDLVGGSNGSGVSHGLSPR